MRGALRLHAPPRTSKASETHHHSYGENGNEEWCTLISGWPSLPGM